MSAYKSATYDAWLLRKYGQDHSREGGRPMI